MPYITTLKNSYQNVTEKTSEMNIFFVYIDQLRISPPHGNQQNYQGKEIKFFL